MNRAEKLFSILALLYLVIMGIFLVIVPTTRNLSILLPLSFIGIIVNAGLLFIVFKDIFSRTFVPEHKKIVWIIVILLFLPAVVVYLPRHGFKPR